METNITPTKIGKNGDTKIVDKKNGYRDKVTKVNSYETGVEPDRRGNNMKKSKALKLGCRVTLKVKAKSVEVPLAKFRPQLSKIYSDELLLQRLLDIWDDSIATSHMLAFLEGHSNIYSLVLIDIEKVLDDAKGKLKNFNKEDAEYSNIKTTIDYLEGILSKGYDFLCIDGQHRINCYKRYLASEFKLTKSFIFDMQISDNEWIPYDIKGKYFKELPEIVQQHILEEYNVLITMVQSGSMEDLVNVTIYTNLGEPWSKHEMRVILPSSFNLWLHDFQKTDPLLTKVFTQHISDMSGKDYKLTKKGDSLLISEWVAYIHNAYKGKIYVWPKSDMLDSMSSIEGLKTLSKKVLEDAKSIISKMATLVHADGRIVSVKRSTIDNLIILLTAFYNSNHKSNPYKKVISIENERSFYDWFLKTDAKLREKDAYVIDPTTNKVMKNPTTNTKLKNSESYNSKCGAKKTDDIQLRITELMKAFGKSYDKLFSDGVVSLIDDSKITKKQRTSTAVNNDFTTLDGKELEYADVFSKDNEIDVDHKSSRKKGGKNEVDNFGLRDASKNRSKGSKVETFV